MPRKPTPRPLGEIVSVLARLSRNIDECEKAGMLKKTRAVTAQQAIVTAMNQLQDQQLDRRHVKEEPVSEKVPKKKPAKRAHA